MSSGPGATIASPKCREPLLVLLFLVLCKVLNATLLHVLDSGHLCHPRDDGKKTLELNEYFLYHETFCLLLGTDDCNNMKLDKCVMKKACNSYR
jgi:hypothetical protein